MPNPTHIAVSYAWKEEDQGEHAGVVDDFCQRLTQSGIGVIRDTDRLKHGDSLSKFMREIGASDCLCIFLSDAYLRSPNCMYELLVAWQRSKDDPDEFRSRVKAWVMPSAKDIWDDDTRTIYLDHWLDQQERAENRVKKYATRGASKGDIERLKRIRQFVDNMNEILDFFRDTLSPGSLDDFQAWARDNFEIQPDPSDEDRIADAYANTCREVEAALTNHENVRSFLGKVTPELIHEDAAGVYGLSDAVRAKNFDPAPAFEAIHRQIDQFAGTAREWDALKLVLGGLLVLALDPKWVLERRAALIRDAIDYPGLEERIPLGEGAHAYFLHVVSLALGDGYARLDHVFGSPERNGRVISDPAKVLKAVNQRDRSTELTKLFIRHILGPERAADHQRMDRWFARVKNILKFAFEKECHPYVASGTDILKLSDVIREELKLEHLVLIHPDGDGDEDAILPNTLFCLKFLHQIYLIIQERRPQNP